MMFGSSAGKEAVLAQIEVEAFETPISESDDRILSANVTLRLMFSRLGSRQTVEDGQPDHGLRFHEKPAQEVGRLNHWLIASPDETRSDTGLDITSAKGSHFAQKTRNLNAVVKKKSEFAFVCCAVSAGN